MSAVGSGARIRTVTAGQHLGEGGSRGKGRGKGPSLRGGDVGGAEAWGGGGGLQHGEDGARVPGCPWKLRKL